MYLIKLPVMSLNGRFILTPDLHPETLSLTELPQSSLGVGGGWVGLAVLLLPGLPLLCQGLGQCPCQGGLQAEQYRQGELHHVGGGPGPRQVGLDLIDEYFIGKYL